MPDFERRVGSQVLQHAQQRGVVSPLLLQLFQGGTDTVNGSKVLTETHSHSVEVAQQNFLILERGREGGREGDREGEGGGGGGGGRGRERAKPMCYYMRNVQ